MSRDECWDHDTEQHHHHREDWQEIRIEADERVYGQEGPGVTWASPAKELCCFDLELEYDANSTELLDCVLYSSISVLPRVESAEIVPHRRETERRLFYSLGARAHRLVIVDIPFYRNDLFEEPRKQRCHY